MTYTPTRLATTPLAPIAPKPTADDEKRARGMVLKHGRWWTAAEIQRIELNTMILKVAGACVVMIALFWMWSDHQAYIAPDAVQARAYRAQQDSTAAAKAIYESTHQPTAAENAQASADRYEEQRRALPSAYEKLLLLHNIGATVTAIGPHAETLVVEYAYASRPSAFQLHESFVTNNELLHFKQFVVKDTNGHQWARELAFIPWP
jgi:hypothetical protein